MTPFLTICFLTNDASLEYQIHLHFGQPWNSSGTNGVRIFDSAVSFRTLAQVQSATQSFAGGYSYCSAFTYGNNTFLYIGVGVNNFGPYPSNAHGAAWGTAVDNIIAALDGTISENRVFVLGAGDLEPGFNTPTTTKNWVLGYFSQSNRFLYNFGTADGCPDYDINGTFDGQCGTANYPTWKQSDVWFVSSGRAGLRAFPEIYATSGVNADQWYQIALYGYRTNQLFSFTARGSLTQFEACNQRSNEAGCQPANPYLKNSPSEGWFQFANALRGDPRTDQTVSYSSDIQWQGE